MAGVCSRKKRFRRLAILKKIIVDLIVTTFYAESPIHFSKEMLLLHTKKKSISLNLTLQRQIQFKDFLISDNRYIRSKYLIILLHCTYFLILSPKIDGGSILELKLHILDIKNSFADSQM